MAKLGGLLALPCFLMPAGSSPSSAGCICKDTRTTWCAKNCYVCFSNHAAPAGYCSIGSRSASIGEPEARTLKHEVCATPFP
jgi:hypothetical protein